MRLHLAAGDKMPGRDLPKGRRAAPAFGVHARAAFGEAAFVGRIDGRRDFPLYQDVFSSFHDLRDRDGGEQGFCIGMESMGE